MRSPLAAMTLSVILVLAPIGLPRDLEGQEGRLFSSDDVLEMILETDLGQLLSDRSEDSEEQPATVTVTVPGDIPDAVSLRVRTRGRFRLRRDICPFPPIRLNFPSEGTDGSVFQGADKIKLVTHCHDRRSYEQNVLEEYLAYRIFNLISDVSFRVRLARITYRDSEGKEDDTTKYGFLIEDPASLAARVGGDALEIPGARATEFEPEQMGNLFLFQYLIGNIDWATANMQNLEVFRIGFDYFAVPYDFDWSGIVDAPYAGPSPLTERLHQSVTERLYLGVCWEAVDYPAVISHFMDLRQDILALPETIPGLSEANIRTARRYIDDFYGFIENPDRAVRDLRRMCKSGGQDSP